MHRNNKVKTTTFAALALTFLSLDSAKAWWSVDYSSGSRFRLIEEKQLYTGATSYFNVSLEELTKPLQVGSRVAIINSGGVIDRIITLTESTDLSNAFAAVAIPRSGGVKYMDDDGIVRLEAINQGDIVSVQTPQGVKTINDKVDLTDKTAVINSYSEPTGDPVSSSNSSTVTAVTISSNNSVSMTITPPVAQPNTHVSVQVVTDGRSHSSVGTDNQGTPVTINDVPASSNVTVQTSIVNNVTGENVVIQNPVISTPSAPIPVLTPARNEASDKATIAQPVVTSQEQGSNGHRSANVEVPVIPNFDPSKTNVQLVIRDKNGSTTAMGLGGEGGVVKVDSLSPTESYTITVVIRDLTTGRETSIAGNRLP